MINVVYVHIFRREKLKLLSDSQRSLYLFKNINKYSSCRTKKLFLRGLTGSTYKKYYVKRKLPHYLGHNRLSVNVG